MIKSNEFEAVVSNIHSVLLPEEEVQPFVDNGHERAVVLISFNGKTLKIHTSLQKRSGFYRASLNKQLQKQLGIQSNDSFIVQLLEDTTKYGVEMPEELQAVLDTDLEAQAIFDSLTSGKQRTLIYMIIRFKNSQTRIDKSLLLVDNLKRGIRDNKLLLKAQ